MTVFVSRNPWKLGEGRSKGTKTRGDREMESRENRDSRSNDIGWSMCLDFIQKILTHSP